ncbi:lactate utilization protein [Candidatus Roizmanbacteria bacterium]|nr:lactate utilization protein [Candidatus Roizmanbacteria bacterium]
MAWDKLPEDSVIKETEKALNENGIKAIVVEDGEEAKKKVLELIPKGSQVMTATSTTVDQINLSKTIDEGEDYDSTRKKIMSKDQSEMRTRLRRINAAVDYVVGSVHAVTEDGKVLVASNSGSQLPSYAFAAEKVVWVVGAQKIVKNVDEGIKRIYEYTLKLEDERMQKAYGMGSGVSKLLIINKEINPDRITLILVKEKLGF